MRIVVIGGGFAGISAKAINKEAIVIDEREYFELTPKLVNFIEGEGAETALIPRNVDLKEKVRKIDFKERTVETQSKNIKYDKLIIAIGYEQDLSRIKGAERYSLKYEGFRDAMKLKDKVKSVNSLIIAGGGPLGIELAGSIVKANSKVKVKLIEAEDRLLPFLSPETSRYALKLLEEIGVEVELKTSIEEIVEGGALTSKGLIKGELVVFAGGFKGNSLIREWDLSSKNDRMLVNEYLMSVDYEDVFGAGDCATFKNGFIPQSAQIASQSGEVAMRNALSKGELIKFRPKTRAIVLRVGDKYFGELEGKFIKGNTAKLIKNVAIELTKSKIRIASTVPQLVQ